MTEKESIQITGYSEGDRSVGISSIYFSIDTGLTELSADDKEFIIKGIIRDIWELHDNGDLRYEFSDEAKEDDFDCARIFTVEMSEKILKEAKNERKKI